MNKQDAMFDYLLNLLIKTDNKEQLDTLFNVLITDKEKQELVNRLKIFALLKQGKTQREISAVLGVGIATVSRGAKVFQQFEIESLLPEVEKVVR